MTFMKTHSKGTPKERKNAATNFEQSVVAASYLYRQ